MIYETPNTGLEINGVFFGIGATVKGTDSSEYEGLTGHITEIRTDPDKDTENEGADIYCSFNPPETEEEIKNLEAIFSDLYQQPKTIDDIILDDVIMAAEMLQVISEDGDGA